MNNLDWVMLLAQNAFEKRATIIGITLFGGLIFMLFLDSIIKGKFVPKNSAIRKLLFFIFFICALVLFFLLKYVY